MLRKLSLNDKKKSVKDIRSISVDSKSLSFAFMGAFTTKDREEHIFEFDPVNQQLSTFTHEKLIDTVQWLTILRAVQHRKDRSMFTLYFSSGKQQISYLTNSPQACVMMCALFNSISESNLSLLKDFNDMPTLKGSVMKQGKSSFANRWIVIVGGRLLIFRNPQGEEKAITRQIPLNCLLLGSTKSVQTSRDTLQLTSMKQYTLRFSNEGEAKEWIQALKVAEKYCLEQFTQCVAILEKASRKKNNIMVSNTPPTTSPASNIPVVLEDVKIENKIKKEDFKVEEIKKEGVSKENYIIRPEDAHVKRDLFSVVKDSEALIKKVYLWGSNDYGQLGNGKRGEANWQPEPQFVEALKTKNMPESLALGDSFCCAISVEHQLFVWGNGENGEMGVGDRGKQSSRPYLSINLRSVKIMQVSCGLTHVLALQSNGILFSWGTSACGALGLGVDRIRADTPQRVTKADSEDRVITQISAGYEHSVYISNPKGYVFTFGKGLYGCLGCGDERNQFTPLQVNSLYSIPIIKVSAGGRFTLFLSDDHEVISCGIISLLPSQMNASCLLPKIISRLEGMNTRVISAGFATAAVIVGEGNRSRVLTWGVGFEEGSALGHGDEDGRADPQFVLALDNLSVCDISCGKSHTLAITSDGRLFAWGRSHYGQLGDGRSLPCLTPKEIETPEGHHYFSAIDAGKGDFSGAILTGGDAPYRSDTDKAASAASKLLGKIGKASSNINKKMIDRAKNKRDSLQIVGLTPAEKMPGELSSLLSKLDNINEVPGPPSSSPPVSRNSSFVVMNKAR